MTDRQFRTSRKVEAIDVTDDLAPLPVGDGFVWVSTPHTTAGLILCEADDEMLRDVESVGERLVAPFEPFLHRKNDNPNAASHLMSSIFGTQLILPVTEGQLALGTYQRVLFVELDGPRDRQIHVRAIAVAPTP